MTPVRAAGLGARPVHHWRTTGEQGFHRGHAAIDCFTAHENPIIVDGEHLCTTSVPDQVRIHHHATINVNANTTQSAQQAVTTTE
ncbi:MAG: hypothetical protein ABW224_24010 [Kibdelosporangium sp.]